MSSRTAEDIARAGAVAVASRRKSTGPMPGRGESLGEWRERTGALVVSVALRSGGLADVLERGRLRMRERAAIPPAPRREVEVDPFAELAELVAGLDRGDGLVVALDAARGALLVSWANDNRARWGEPGRVVGKLTLTGFGVGVS